VAGRDQVSILLIEGLDTAALDKPTSAYEALAALRDTMKHHPMTKEQRQILDQDLATIVKNLGDISSLLNACYGDKDQRVTRAEESQAALQRLLWALERQDQPPTMENAAGSARVREIVEMNVHGSSQLESEI
jgi:hypothetical protein